MDEYSQALMVIGDQQITIRRLEYQLEQAKKEIEELKKNES
jgi:hypothetical protein